MGEGHPEEWTRLGDAALERLEHSPPPALVVCRAMSGIAGIEPQLGRNPTAHAQKWLEAAQAVGDEYEEACAQNILAVGRYMTGDAAALATAEESLRTARRCGSPTVIAYCCFTTALICAEHDPGRALSLLDESQRSAEAAAKTFAVITASGIRGNLLARAGDYHAAAAANLDVARRAFRYGRREQQSNSIYSAAAFLAVQGHDEPAAVLLGWVQSVTGPVDSITNVSLTNDVLEALTRLADNLGDDYASLRAQGAAMTAEDVLEYAHDQINGAPASPT